MIPKISDIFQQKLDEIQSRVPVRIKGASDTVPFEQYLSSASSADTPVDANSALQSVPDDAILDDSTFDAVSPFNGNSGSSAASSLQRALLSLSANRSGIQDKLKLNKEIEDSIVESAQKYHVDANLIRAVIKQESNYNPYAVSSAGAQGLMQLMPGTADSLGVDNPWDVRENIDGGTRYLRDQLVAFGGDLELALAAYNAGPGAVSKYNGVPPYVETHGYVKKVLKNYLNYSNNK